MLDFSFRRSHTKSNCVRHAAFFAAALLTATLLAGCQNDPSASSESDSGKPAKALVNSSQIPVPDESEPLVPAQPTSEKATTAAAQQSPPDKLNNRKMDGSNDSSYVPPRIKSPIKMPVFDDANDPAKLAEKVRQYANDIGPILDKAQKDKDVETVEPGPVPNKPDIKATNTNRIAKSPSDTADSRPVDDSKVEWASPGNKGTIANTNNAQPANAIIEATPGKANDGATLTSAIPNTVNPKRIAISPADVNNTVRFPSSSKQVNPIDAEAKLARHIQEYPRDLWAHLDYQLTHFLRDEQVPQLEPLTPLPLEDRELIAAVMDGLTNFRNGLRADNNTLLSKKVKPLLELSDRLRSQADLNIPTLSLCTKVDGFGVYEPIDPVRFIAGREHMAIIYCEVENFASNPIGDKKEFETKLSQEAALYTETGLLVWADKAGTVIDKSRNRRHDFFIVKKIKLPSTLTIGRYLLKVSVEDLQARRVAEQTMSIEVVAQMETPGANNNTPNILHGNKDINFNKE